MKNTIKFCILLLGISLWLPACKDDDNPANSCNTSFDQQALFENLANEIILPAYQQLQEAVDSLELQTSAFIAAPSTNTLLDLHAAFQAAYEAWQSAAPFEFGPAEAVFLRTSLNNFPTDTAAIESNINTSTWDFDQPDRFDKGFPALDYLLYGLSDFASDIIATYSADQQYRDYLVALVTDIKERVDQTIVGWESDYKNTFISNTGTAAGTSLSLLINNLNQHYELIKREKLGVPSGVLTLGFANPDKVEAFYSGQSAKLALLALQGSERLYLGTKQDGSNGLGLDDYLEAANAQKDGESLNTLIKNRFSDAVAVVAALEDPLSETVETKQEQVVNAYNEVTKQLVNIKTDMPSVLCVSITYIDNPSDSD